MSLLVTGCLHSVQVVENWVLSSLGILFNPWCWSASQDASQEIRWWRFLDLFWTEIVVEKTAGVWMGMSLPYSSHTLSREKGERLLNFKANRVHASDDWNLQTWVWCMSPAHEPVIEETTKCCSCSFTPTSSVSAKICFLHLCPYLACCPPTICIFITYFKWAIK